ncbi:ComEA family DNA-binding protein, partial [Neisseria sp. P0009.S001]
MKKFLFGVFAAVCTAFSLAAVNVNTASSAELEALPGIGPAKAK